MASSLEDTLVEFFKKATVSSTIVKKLANDGEPVEHAKLVHEVNNMMIHLIPDYKFAGSAGDVNQSLSSFEPTVETGLNLLLDAGILVETDSGISLSEVGKELHDRIAD